LSFEIYDADIVITNPTHYAVALKYDANKDGLPIVVAKGADNIALLIKMEAQRYGIPVYEDPLLTRAVWARYDVGCELEPNGFCEAAYAALHAVRMGIYKVRY
jgi:flagellar biosynthetic protein FlhB